MSTNSKLESYLTTLNEHLGAISVSDRSEIIMEIKSHVMDTLDKNPDKNIENVLKDFGSAETIAKKYLDERGIKAQPKKKSTFGTFLKWTMIASASLMILLSLSLFMLIRGITPLVEISDQNVSILGGFVHINDDGVKVGKNFIDIHEQGFALEGNLDAKASLKEIKIKGLDGKFELSEGDAQIINWDCKVDVKNAKILPHVSKSAVELDFTQFKKMDCEITIPSNMMASTKLENGKIEVTDPKGNYDLDLKNGTIDISPSVNAEYNFDLKVQRGVTDPFQSANKKEAFNIKARIENGKISNGAG